MGAGGLLVGGIELYEKAEYKFYGQPARMQLAEPDRKVTVAAGGYTEYRLDVKYVSTGKELAVPQKRLSGEQVQELQARGFIPIVYLRNNPQRVYAHGAQPPLAWGWLIAGVLGTGVFLLSLKLARREGMLGGGAGGDGIDSIG